MGLGVLVYLWDTRHFPTELFISGVGTESARSAPLVQRIKKDLRALIGKLPSVLFCEHLRFRRDLHP